MNPVTERWRGTIARDGAPDTGTTWDAFIEFLPDPAAIMSGSGRTVAANRHLCRLSGRGEMEIRGTCLGDLVRPAGCHDEAGPAEGFPVSGSAGARMALACRDGREVPVWVKTSRLPLSRGDMAFLVSLQDITRQNEKEQLKDEFIGLVAHELRSPLTVVLGSLRTALSEDERLSTEDRRQLLGDAVEEAESMSALLGNLLALASSEAGEPGLCVGPVDMERVIRNAADRVERISGGHAVVTQVTGGLPAIAADEMKLERVLHNLLENAVKYSPPGEEIRVSARVEGGMLRVEVKDGGTGIPEEDRERIFRPYVRLETAVASGMGGTGLGLLACRRLVEAHGGMIGVDSANGRGSTFWFTLPLSRTLAARERGRSL